MDVFYQTGTLLALEEHTGSSVATGRHFHSLYEFYYLCQGEIAYFIDDRIYTIKKGDLVIIPPRTLHKSITLRKPKRKRILLYLDPSFLQGEPEASRLLPADPAFFHLGEQERLQRIMTEMIIEYKEQRNMLMLKALVCELLVLLQRQNTVDSTVPPDGVSSSRILEVVTYINEGFASELTLTNVAERFYMNPSYLSRLFKQSTGFTFSEYLNKYRVKKAVELLMTTNKNVTEIALATGFNSSNHFCKTFKGIMRVSPLTYRRSLSAG